MEFPPICHLLCRSPTLIIQLKCVIDKSECNNILITFNIKDIYSWMRFRFISSQVASLLTFRINM